MQAGYPDWSHDGEWVHFVTLTGQRTWYRVRVGDRKLERLFAENEEQRLVRAENEAQRLIRAADTWTGTAPDDRILTVRDTGTREIYALEWEAP